MPIATTYTISNTNGTLSFDIKVGKTNTQNSDLTFYGYGSTGWGKEVDQNFYRLLENFACIEHTAAPTATPSTKDTLGGIIGRGINKPIIGQNWYNLTTHELYVCKDPVTNAWTHIISEAFADDTYLQISVAAGTGPTGFVKNSGNTSTSPMTGPLYLSGPPTEANGAATKGYTDSSITTLTNTVTGNYVHKAGDNMTGDLFVGTTAGSYTQLSNGFLELGKINGTAYTPCIDFHSSGGTTDYDSRIIASGGNVNVVGQGVLELIGFVTSDGRDPTMPYQFTTKSWVDIQVNNAVLTASANANNYLPKAGGTMTGAITMSNNSITGLPSPSTGSGAVSLDFANSKYYAPAGTAGASHQIHYSTLAPSGPGLDGDIWIKY